MNADYVPAVVAEVKGLRVGVIGLTTNIDTRTGQAADPTLAVASPVQAVENILPAVAEISDVVVILSHCGYGAGMHRSGKAGSARMIGEGDLTIAEAAGPLTDKPVVLIGGHSHTALNTGGIDPDNLVKGVLITQAGANGGYLGETVMSVAAENGRKAWFTSVGLHAVKARDDRVKEGEEKYAGLEHDGDYDSDFENVHVKPLRDALEVKLAEIIGTVAADAQISKDITIAQRYVGEAAIANFMNDALVERSATFPGGRVDLAAFNATGLAAGVEPGKLSFRAWYDVMPYADTVHVATMTGAQIRDMLISNAKRIVRPQELAAGKVELDGFVSRGFLHFSSGLRYHGETRQFGRRGDRRKHRHPRPADRTASRQDLHRRLRHLHGPRRFRRSLERQAHRRWRPRRHQEFQPQGAALRPHGSRLPQRGDRPDPRHRRNLAGHRRQARRTPVGALKPSIPATRPTDGEGAFGPPFFALIQAAAGGSRLACGR